MTGSWRNGKAFLVITSALAGAAVAVSIGLAYPRPVTNTALGADWQCHRSVGIVTTCHRVSHAQPTNYRPLPPPADTLQA
jgi:hypothetical protein